MNLLAALLAGGHLPDGSAPGSHHLSTVKTVDKHWGNERWLVPEGSVFGFKLISINAGKRTSLHYHQTKEEANLVLSGEGWLHLADSADPAGTPRTAYPLTSGQIVHIRPGRAHRVEAVTDLVIVEVSTPELDDVIRLEDDLHRGNGRIAAEHN